jgi:hypothetical protein
MKSGILNKKIRGSGKNSSRIRIPDPGGKKAQDPGSGSAKRDATITLIP